MEDKITQNDGIPGKDDQNTPDQKPELKTGGKRKRIILIAVAAVVLICAFLGIRWYTSPAQRAKRAIDLGAKYLSELNYEQAVAKFSEAVEIDPNNTETTERVASYMDEIITAAIEAGEMKEYTTQVQLAEYLLQIPPETELIVARHTQAEELKQKGELYILIGDILRQADKDFEEGRYEEAQKGYEDAVQKGATDEEVEPELSLCVVYRALLKACKSGDWDSAAACLDGAAFEKVVPLLKKEGPVFTVGTEHLVAGVSEGSYYIIYGSLTKEQSDGKATGLVSSANTYCLYEGQWKQYQPDGNGIMKSWNKNEDREQAVEMQGLFAEGLMNSASYSHEDLTDVELQMSVTGGIGVVNVDEDGNLWVTEEDRETHVTHIALNETESGGVIDSYTAGVPGFGGDDAKLEVERIVIDKTPPVLSCSLGVTNGWEPYYERGNIVGFGISANDDVDGNITDRITSTQTRRAAFVGGDYGLVVVYTVSDTAGNTSTMTVSYDHEFFCGLFHYWYVRAVKKN
ncbi:MAG: hypothetical protein IK016_04275 [Lachnospiraceae bacterium]|nr:hypothetical protein [Lachnospiraceae bacterium]